MKKISAAQELLQEVERARQGSGWQLGRISTTPQTQL